MKWQLVPPEEYVVEAHTGDRVEVQVSPGIWVPAHVVHDMETRISVKLDNPILIITRKITITHRLFSFKPTVLEEEENNFTTTLSAGRAYVRYPPNRSA